MSDTPIAILYGTPKSRGTPSIPLLSGGSAKISILNTWPSLQSVGAQWREWQQNPNADIEFFQFIVEVRSECEQPYVIAVQDSDEIQALLVGRLEYRQVDVKIGYLQVAPPQLRIISFIYGGLLGTLNQQSSDEVVRVIVGRLALGDADAAFFSHVPQDSPLARSLRSIPRILRRDSVPIVQPHRSSKVIGDFNSFCAGLSPKVRKNQKWQAKKLLESVHQQAELRCYTRPEDLDVLFGDVDKVARTTYQRGLGVGFVDNVEMRGRIQLSSQRGWLQAFILYLAGKPAAFWIGTRYRNRFFSDFMGYDATHAKYSPGMYLVLKSIERMCSEVGQNRIKEIDWGLGDAQYKQVLATDCWLEESSYIYSLSLRGAALNVSRTIAGVLDKGARGILRKLNLEDTIKTGWRRRFVRR